MTRLSTGYGEPHFMRDVWGKQQGSSKQTTDWIGTAYRTWLQGGLGPGDVVLFLR